MSDQTQIRHVWLQEPATESCSDHQGGTLVLVLGFEPVGVSEPGSHLADSFIGLRQCSFHNLQLQPSIRSGQRDFHKCWYPV